MASHRHVERAVIADLNDAPFPSKPVIPFGKPIHDRLRMEIARGCTRGCRFCQAGMIYRPVRERQPDDVLASVHKALEQTGYDDLSLLSLSTGDYSCIAPLMKHIMTFGEKDRLAVSLPSLRAGSLSPELMELIKKVRKTGFTIAPEAGSQRLRDVINKNISEEDIIETVENAFALGWKLIKLYFMIGLPTETQADIEAIVTLVKRLKTISRTVTRGGRINVSVATFVPKPHTPFQWEPQHSLEEALRKINWLKENLKMPGIQVKWQDPKVSVIEGVWARGDRQLNRVLVQAWKRGCRFDGWTDFFDYDRWMRVFAESGVDASVLNRSASDMAQPLPWEHIKIGVDHEFLVQERKRAIDGKTTGDCRTGACSGCGVCDFDRLRPISFHNHKMESVAPSTKAPAKSTDDAISYVIKFKKMEKARFLGHLEMVKVFARSLRRAKIPLKYSNGYHPMPKISFGDTLPMGMQSENEHMRVILTQALDAKDIIDRLQSHLPLGIELSGCYRHSRQNQETAMQTYLVELKDGFFNRNDLEWFLEQQIVNIKRKNKKGQSVVVDLKKAVDDIALLDKRRLRMSLGRDNNMLIRPAQVLNAVFDLTQQQILTAIITKMKNNHV
jgi:radical SAM-linked protein